MKHRVVSPFAGLAAALVFAPATAFALGSGGPLRHAAALNGYQIGETNSPESPSGDSAPPNGAARDAGPVRLARFSYVSGNVTWRPNDDTAWSDASVNLPLRQGAQIWVTNGGRAEIQFDDGSALRLGNGAVASLQTLYSDSDGEFTEIALNEGVSSLELRHAHSVFQIDTPLVSIKSDGPSRLRVGVGDATVELAVRSGYAKVEGAMGKTRVEAGSYLDIADSDTSYQIGALPGEDSWDLWNDERDRQVDDADSRRCLPSNIALVAGDLDDYGTWRQDDAYGMVWCPTVTDVNWRPYECGRWVWVDPFGWTWVSSEAWGWAPYHYGTWICEPYGWAWVPGPARQYWCPAVVHFSECDGDTAWAPLAPSEVRYPRVIATGYRHGEWSLFFSVGGCAVYYPHDDHYCEPRPFRMTRYNTMVIHEQPRRNTYLRDTRFMPINASRAPGVTVVRTTQFGGVGEYRPAPRTAATGFWTRGRPIGAPAAGAAPIAGPIGARPTPLSFTPSRSFRQGSAPTRQILERPIFRSQLPQTVAQTAPQSPLIRTFTQGGAPSEPGVRRGETQPSRPVSANPVRTGGEPAHRGTEPSRNPNPNPPPNNGGTRRTWGGPAETRNDPTGERPPRQPDRPVENPGHRRNWDGSQGGPIHTQPPANTDQQHQTEQQRREDEQRHRQEDQQRADEQRRQEQQQREEQQRQADQQREEQQRHEQQQRADEQKRQEQQQRADEQKRQEQQQRADEQKRQEQQQREEQQRREEEQRKQDQQRREEEQRKQDEDNKKKSDDSQSNNAPAATTQTQTAPQGGPFGGRR